MSNTHEQAMQYIFKQVLERVLDNMSRGQRASLQLLIQRVLVAAGGIEYIGQFQLLVVHGADARSVRLLAFLRAAQLSIALRARETFRLRVMVTALPACNQETLELHERCFNTLFLHDDPRAELLMIEGQALVPFCKRAVTSSEPWAHARESMLLFGHLTQGRPEALLGSRLHLQLADALHGALVCVDGASALVTVIPERQRRRFLAWSRRCLRLAGEPIATAPYLCLASTAEALARLHALVNIPADAPEPSVRAPGLDSPLRVMAVDDLMHPTDEDTQLERMLGVLHVGAQCLATPMPYFDIAALGYLRRLRQNLLQRAGSSTRLALKDRDSVGHLPACVQTPERFLQTSGVSEQQLVCMLHAPFVEQGRRLADYVHTCHPAMRVALPYLHRALQGKPCPEPIKQWLRDVSGLSLVQLKVIYAREVRSSVRRLLANLARRDVSLRLLKSQAAVCEAPRQAGT